MPPETWKSLFARVLLRRGEVPLLFQFFIAVGIVVALVWGAQVYTSYLLFGKSGQIFYSLPANPPPPNDWVTMSVSAESTKNALLTGLATALVGAVGWLIATTASSKAPRHMYLWPAFLAVICAGLSLYSDYKIQQDLVSMLTDYSTFNPGDPVYSFWNDAQFASLVAGVFFFAVSAIQSLGEAQGDTHESV
jgi:hypothetical protein